MVSVAEENHEIKLDITINVIDKPKGSAKLNEKK